MHKAERKGYAEQNQRPVAVKRFDKLKFSRNVPDMSRPNQPPNIAPHTIVDIPPMPMMSNNLPLPGTGF